MKQEATPEAQLEATNEALRQLQSQLKKSERQIASLTELVEKHQFQLTAQQSSIARLDRILMEMLTGRTWRTLRAAGDLVKKLSPSNLFRSGTESVALSPKRSYLVCDEPKATDARPRTGKILVRGWCVAEEGVDSVQVDVAGAVRVETAPSVPRPDVKQAHPDLDQTGQAGFSVEFDSLALTKGRHPITIRLVSKGAVLREAKTAVVIDHEKGFASAYDQWIADFEQPDNDLIQLKLPSLKPHPLISIVMPVYNTDPAELTAAIESVLHQSYSNWELCIADDFSTREEVPKILEDFSRREPRIKVVFRDERGGISKACNTALESAAGEYISFLDHDDTLSPHALAYICEALDRVPQADFLYSDEDKIDRKGKRFEPFFKPDWSPDLLLSENYICHFLVLRKDLLQKAGHFNPAYDGSQDYDLILRAVEHAGKIEHIPKVLYHWRAGVASTATAMSHKQYALDAAQNALQSHCDRSGNQARVEPGNAAGSWRLRYPITEGSHVSIIIASGGKPGVLRDNLKSLVTKTTYSSYEVVVIDNSKHEAIQALTAEFRSVGPTLRYIDWRNKPFNYSVINNAAARQCESPFLLFLNDDTSVIAPGWLEAMAELITRPDVGAVGAKLLYPNGRIQHAGVVMGIYDNCGHAFKGLDGNVSHYFDFPDVIRNVSAVTGACLMTRANVFWQAGGFDESDFAVAFNDIDLCLKIGRLGYRVLYTPHAILHHHEAFSKTSKDLIPHPEEVARMRSKWEQVIAGDPYYNPNLTRNEEDYSPRTR
ncbi:MAG: glycosyltransferase [Acidobacteriaceae bacterium]|nr:glycosyltransferase [Acidobacteriaceae bacterium]MBV9296534.1 glycosyltransferase [Acidobacteriaceae bacterium]MBV9763329.1 glycosyltransferase [Acidobacteriaceae bacterium]